MRSFIACLFLSAEVLLTAASPSHANRLIHEKSPYLLQHVHNPVEWYPCDGLEDDEQGNAVAMHSPNPVAEGASVRDPEVGSGDKDREVSSVTGDRYDDATRSDGQLPARDGLFTVKAGLPECDRSAPPEYRSNPPENRDGVFTVKDGQFTVE